MQLAWFQLLVSSVKLLPPAEFQLFKAHFPDPSEVRGQLDPFLSCFESQALYAVAHKKHVQELASLLLPYAADCNFTWACACACNVELETTYAAPVIIINILEGECTAFLASGSELTAAE